ncbi:MAG: aminotransferase class I/II-fold pyridoxal phosphate-dependent enzyme, partial [Actinomycetota bacterium]
MSRGRIATRVAAIAPSATLAVTNKANELRAAGESVIGFGAGEPDFPTPDYIVEAAVEACRDPKNHRYSPAGGLPELKEALVAKTARDSGYEVAANQVVVTNGGKHAVFNAIAGVVDEGDEVLIPTPFWTTYPEPVRLAGGVPVPVETTITSGFRATVEQLDAAKTDRTKALIFVSPSNPSGAVYPRAEIEAIGQWAADNDIWVLTDEIYEHLVY